VGSGRRFGNWEAVVIALTALSRAGLCDSMPLGLPGLASASLANGPYTRLQVYYTDGSPAPELGLQDRQRYLEEMTGHLRRLVAQGPLWPGDDLTEPPAHPPVMPYRPFGPPPAGGR
jgi:hypothetical protein